jgi:hypothetical protein
MANAVTLTYHLSQALYGELTNNGNGNGVNAYLWYNAYAKGGNASPFTTIISNGERNGGTLNSTTNTYDWDLTLTTDASVAATQVSGGKVYLIIQSNPTTTPTANDLITLIGTTEGNITPANAVAWNFSYDTFEVALANNTADVADLSAINSFGHQFGISAVIGGTTVARGYNPTYDAEGIAGLINTAAAGVPDPSATAPAIDFPTGSTLAGTPMIAITPATDNGQQAPPAYSDIWQASNWQNYVTTVGGLSGVELVGYFNGASDAKTNGIYHNPGYYDYTVAAQAISGNATLSDGNYFILSPTASSQIKGYIAISETSLMGNLYSPGLASAPAYIFSDAALQDPYTIENTPSGTPAGETNTGRNDQWGNIFTQLFTGFTGGYFGGTGVSIPASESSPHAPANTVNLNQNYNWDPTYAFDGARASGTTLTGQHYDPYAKIFFDNSNVYGTAYGDALTTQFTASVTLPVYSGSTDVANIDLWAFGSGEKMTTVPGTGGTNPTPLANFYAPYTINNYLAPGGADYAVPTAPSVGNNLSLTLANNGLVIDPDTADIQLGIYLGNGQFQYIDLPSGAAQNGGGAWQNWHITQDTSKPAGQQFAIESIPIPANFSATPPTAYVPYTASGQVGALGFDNLPAVASATNWYQLIVGGKTFNFYATLDGSSYVTALAADGLASITPPAASQTSMSLLLVPGSMNALPGALMEAFATESTVAKMVQPTSPVAGTLSGAPNALVLSAIQTGAGQGQSVNLNSSVYLTATTSLGFGWTGESNSVNQPSWISGATNKILASDIARVEVVDLLTGLSAMVWNVSPDIDGQWLTPASFSFTAGAYAVTMTEMLSDGTPFGKASSPVYIVVSATGVISGTAAEISGALDAYQAVHTSLTSITISGGQPLTIDWADITADAQALALIPGGAYTLNVVDSSTTIMTNIAALNGNAKVAGIGFTDATPPTLDFTYTEFTTTYSTAIGKMMGERTIAVTGVTGETYTSFNQVYDHGVLSSGANGAGVLALTQYFTTGYSSAGPITSAATLEHDTDNAGHTVRDIYTTAVFAALPAPYPVASVPYPVTVPPQSPAPPPVYPSSGPSNNTFTSVQYDYANGGVTPVQTTYTYGNTSGPPGSITEVDVFDVNNNQISQAFSGYNPQSNNGVAETETHFAMINNHQVITSTKNVYEYSQPVNGNHYTMAEETKDSLGRELKHVFSGLFGLEGQVFSSYEHHFLGGVYSGSRYASDKIEGEAFTGGEIWLDVHNNISKIVFDGVTSQPYSSYSYDYSYDNGAWGGGGVVAQTYFYTNVEGQAYTSYEVELDGAGATTSVTYTGYTVTGSQPYAAVEYFYSGGVATGAYNGYVTHIAGKHWTGEVHGFDTSGQLIQQMFTGVTTQPYTSYENDYAGGVLTGQKFYYTNVVGRDGEDYSTYEVDLTATGAVALEIYNMNDAGHVIIGRLSTGQTLNSIFDDTMTGGGGVDIFNFTPFFGDATITDFTSGTDQIQLATSEFANFAYVQAHSSVVGGNTVIAGSNGDSITLQGITTLQESDFLFA